MNQDLLPVKVLQIGMTRNIGGLETYLMQQFDHLDRNKVVYDFVNITNEYDIVFADKIRKAGSKIFGVCSRHKNPLKHYWQWIKLLRKESKNYKAIVLNTNSLEYIFPLFLGKIMGIPVRIIHSHNGGFENKIGQIRRALLSFNRILMKWSVTDYFACSNLAGQWMFGNTQPFTVIHNAINTKDLVFNDKVRQIKRSELKFDDEDFVVGHVGRFVYQKDHEFLIDVFNEVHNKRVEAKLLLIGDYVGDDTYYKKALEQVKRLNLEESVLFLGIRHDVAELMQAMDCFVMPSRFEGLTVVGVEAQACGLPCFFSDNITKELKLVDGLCYFIDKKLEKKTWADIILKKSAVTRRDTSKDLSLADYDIDTEVNKIMSFYLKEKN